MIFKTHLANTIIEEEVIVEQGKESIQGVTLTDINGKPIKNCIFCVLWWKTNIPAVVPIPPPIAVIINKVFSGILQAPFLAFLLSSHIIKKPNKLITIK